MKAPLHQANASQTASVWVSKFEAASRRKLSGESCQHHRAIIFCGEFYWFFGLILGHLDILTHSDVILFERNFGGSVRNLAKTKDKQRNQPSLDACKWRRCLLISRPRESAGLILLLFKILFLGLLSESLIYKLHYRWINGV